ncbi:DEAD/DEAH box helicase [Pseudoduganella ginsengisoli]|nr:AAA domain-containing protein [Pseudoduganella ginsengisoli]
MSTQLPLLTPTDKLLSGLMALIQDEHGVAVQRLLDVWQRPLEEKITKGWTQRFTHLERGEEPGTLWAYPDASESRFREGDFLFLHQGNWQDALCRQLTFEFEDDERWLLRGHRAGAALNAYQGGLCYAEADLKDLTKFYKIAFDEIEAGYVGREVVMPLLLNQLRIEFDERDMADAGRVARAEGCNDKQAEAVSWAHGARHVACIQGPPGTGKTRVLALIARLAVERGERILMTSHTHTAINHALNKIHEQGVPVVKVGVPTQRRGLSAQIRNVDSLDGWNERPTNGYVVGATPFATCTARLQNYAFDTIIFDEASQVTVPLALMAMRKGKRFIFIGDQKQLPPVLQSRSVLDKHAYSVFARLTSPKAEHLVMLEETYRMNRWLTAWPSNTFYGGALRAAGGNRERRLQLGAVPPRFAQVLDGAYPAVFIGTPDRTARMKNWEEARLVAEICAAAAEGGLALSDIGIVTPYRAQGRAIRNCLAQRFGHAAARQVVADTVERMQGQEREMIILSLATGDEVFLGAVAEFFFQPERLNVSVTRAMTKLIVIGPDVPEASGHESPALRTWVHWYREMTAQCHRVDV